MLRRRIVLGAAVAAPVASGASAETTTQPSLTLEKLLSGLRLTPGEPLDPTMWPGLTEVEAENEAVQEPIFVDLRLSEADMRLDPLAFMHRFGQPAINVALHAANERGRTLDRVRVSLADGVMTWEFDSCAAELARLRPGLKPGA